VLVDVALVQDGVVATADHDGLGLCGLVRAVRSVVRLRCGLRRVATGVAAVAAGDGLALTGTVRLLVRLVRLVGGRSIDVVAAVLGCRAAAAAGTTRAPVGDRDVGTAGDGRLGRGALVGVVRTVVRLRGRLRRTGRRREQVARQSGTHASHQ